MHAIEVAEHGGPEVLNYVDRPRPFPGPGEVLIKAEAIGVNFVDTYFRSGLYPHELPFVLGAEVAGTVAAVGDGVTSLHIGDRVACADAVGAYAEYCVAPVDLVARVPDRVGFDVAAAALLKGMTAHLLIKSVYRVQTGDTVLLHAGAGGVGLILTQWATSLGARVITTASTPEKAQLSRGAGASLAVRGTLALFGASSGPVPPVDPQRLNAAGSVYLARPSRPHFLRTHDEFLWRTGELFNLIGDGSIEVTVSGHYPLKDVAQAHRDLQARKTIGSVVLNP